MSYEPLPGSIAAIRKAERLTKRPASVYDPALPMPSTVDDEKRVISALMQAPAFAVEATSRLKPEHFSCEALALIWEIVMRQINCAKPTDPVTVTGVFYDLGLIEKIGGPAIISEIHAAAHNPAYAAHYATQVHEKWRQRQVVTYCTKAACAILAGIEHEELAAILGDLDGNLLRISQETLNSARGLRSGEEVLIDALDRLKLRHQHKGQILGLQFGFPDLDRRVNGFQSEDFIVVGARPAMGKTSLATSFAQNVCIDAVNRDNRPVLMFTLEMSDVQIMERSVLGRARIGLRKGRTGMFSDAEACVLYAFKDSLTATRGQSPETRLWDLVAASKESMDAYCQRKGRYDRMDDDEKGEFLAASAQTIETFAGAVAATASGQFTFYDGYGVTVQELRTTIRQWIRRIGWKRGDHFAPPLVVIDYLQLVKASLKANMGDPRLTSIEVCEAMKGLAKETGIVIMGLAQVKVNDKRPDAEPQMSDIKESGAFAEYPDYVFTLHRQSYYKKWDTLTEEQQAAWEKQSAHNPQAQEASGLPPDKWCGKAYYTGLTKIGIKKARHCPTDDVKVFFRGDEVRFIPITTDLYSTNGERREKHDD